VGGPEGRRRLGKPGRRREDNVKMNPQEEGLLGGGSWTQLLRLRIVRARGRLYML
jgi:hypothetical protein